MLFYIKLQNQDMFCFPWLLNNSKIRWPKSMKWKCALTSWTISWLRWRGMMWWVNLSYGKTFTKTWTLFCNIALKRVGQWCCTFYQPRSKPVLQQIRFQVAWIQTSKGWNYAEVTRYTGIKSLAAKQVCLGSLERVICFNFDAKSRTSLYFLQKLFATCNNLICCKTRLTCGW